MKKHKKAIDSIFKSVVKCLGNQERLRGLIYERIEKNDRFARDYYIQT